MPGDGGAGRSGWWTVPESVQNRAMYRLRAADRLRYFLERQFIKGAGYQLLVVAGTIGLVSLLGGLLILPTGEESSSEAVWWAFLRLTDPGYLGDDAGTWRRTVSTMLTISGYVLFMGTLIAILTQWLTRTMRALEQGLTPITVRGHVAILGLGSRTLPVVAEILGAGERLRQFLRIGRTRRLNIAVLSERVDAEVAQRFRRYGASGRHARDIILRSGSALQTEDLHRVNVADAGAIILAGGVFARSELQSEDVATIKTLIALRDEARPRRGRPAPLVVAELQDRRQVPVARAAYPGPLALVAVDQVLNRILVQQLRYPGVARVFEALLSRQGSHRFHVRDASDFAGGRFGELQAHFPDALVCGLVRPDGDGFSARLNPPAATRLQRQDRVVLIAATHDATEPRSGNRVSAPVAIAATWVPPPSPPHRLLVLGWNRRHVALLEELAGRPDMPVEITFVSLHPAQERTSLCAPALADVTHVQCRQIEADFVVDSELAACRPEHYDSIYIATSDLIESEQEADARTVVGHLVLSRTLATAQKRPRVLLELADAGNASMLGSHRDDVLVPPLVISHMLGQGALRRELLAVFEALLQRDGADLMLVEPDLATEPEARAGDVATLRTHLLSRGLLLLGWLDGAGALQVQPPDGETLPAGLDVRWLVLSAGTAFDAP